MSEDAKRLDPEGVNAELERVLSSDDFDASDRNRRFLRHVVEETLKGRGDRIKGYVIATEVFGRSDSFDPQADPIVRIEARRLRRALERYYLTAGRNSPLRISIPKGRYIPVFESAKPDKSAALLPPHEGDGADQASTRKRPAVFVSVFEQEGEEARFPDFAQGFTRHLIVGLTRFGHLSVFGPATTFDLASRAGSHELSYDLGADLLLSGSTILLSDRFQVDAVLIDLISGQNIWGESIERELRPDEIFSVRNDLADSIARSVAQPYGVVYNHVAADLEDTLPGNLISYQCVVQFHKHWQHFEPDSYEQVRRCLEKTIRLEPAYAEAYACLSQIFTNAFRFGLPSANSVFDDLQRAVDLAERAVDLAPRSSRGYHALGFALWFLGRIEESLDAFETGLALNPNDSEIMADLGLRCAFLERWDRSTMLLNDAFACNPGLSGGYRVGLALFHYMHGRYEEALVEAHRIRVPDVVHSHVCIAICAARAGHVQEAKGAVEAILGIDPAYGAGVNEDLQKRNLSPDIIRAVVDGLQEAGLSVARMTTR